MVIIEPMNYKVGDDFVALVDGDECVVRVLEVLENRGIFHQYKVMIVDKEYENKF